MNKAIENLRSNRSTIRIALLGALLIYALTAALFFHYNPLAASARNYAVAIKEDSLDAHATLKQLGAKVAEAEQARSASPDPNRTESPLEPIRDAMNKIGSTVLIVAIVASVVQISIAPITAIGGVIVSGALAALLIGPKFAKTGRMTKAAAPILWYGLFLLFAVPVAFILSDAFASVLTAGNAQRSHETLQNFAQAVNAAGSVEAALAQVEAPNDATSRMSAQAREVISACAALLSVYVFRILILPGMLLGGLFLFCRSMARRQKSATSLKT